MPVHTVAFPRSNPRLKDTNALVLKENFKLIGIETNWDQLRILGPLFLLRIIRYSPRSIFQ